jgi:hypothetical protein
MLEEIERITIKNINLLVARCAAKAVEQLTRGRLANGACVQAVRRRTGRRTALSAA